jgi:protein ImuA
MPALARTSADFLDAIHADVWHAHALSTAPLPVLATGDAALDAQLPGGGWPVGALTEILQPPGVHSEWRLLLPALARSGLGPVLLVGAPHLPFAPALAAQGLALGRMLWVTAHSAASRLWACEQALRCAEVNAVLAWLPQVRSEQLRRLQMAASEYSKLLFVMRPQAAQDEASPAALRLHVQPHPATQVPASAAQGADGLHIQVLKRRGPPLERPVQMQARSPGLSLLLEARHALDRSTARA